MTTITQGLNVITPNTVDGYTAKRPSRTILHAIIGRADFDVTLQPAQQRTGDLRLVFGSEIDAWDAVALLSGTGSFVLADSDIPDLDMTFVVSGDTVAELDDETRNAWIVTITYQEVNA